MKQKKPSEQVKELERLDLMRIRDRKKVRMHNHIWHTYHRPIDMEALKALSSMHDVLFYLSVTHDQFNGIVDDERIFPDLWYHEYAKSLEHLIKPYHVALPDVRVKGSPFLADVKIKNLQVH